MSQGSKHYRAVVQRLLEVVVALDGKGCIHNFKPWKQMVKECSGSFPTGVKWFLLNKLLGVHPAESARMEVVKDPSGVRGMIIRVSDQLRCGKISLSEVDQKEAEAAKACLDAQSKKRRERYAPKRDQINARRRETYALKMTTES